MNEFALTCSTMAYDLESVMNAFVSGNFATHFLQILTC